MYLRLSEDCAKGNNLVVKPDDTLRIVRTINAKDGLAVFVVARVVAVSNTTFKISARQGGLTLGTATVQVSA